MVLEKTKKSNNQNKINKVIKKEKNRTWGERRTLHFQDLHKKSKYTVSVFPLVLSTAVALISVSPK